MVAQDDNAMKEYSNSENAIELAEYFILWTSLKKLRASEVLELYRLRWQIRLILRG